MGTVAVIANDSILLCQLHVNLWILPGLGRQVRFLDVGLRFKVAKESAPFETFDLVIPGSGNPKPVDLFEQTKGDSSSLIFGVPINHEANGKISPANELEPDHISATVVALSEFTSQRADDLKGGASLWRCRLARQWTSADGFGYCRARFFLPHPGRMWTRQGLSPLDGRSLFDLRILDDRENTITKIAADIAERGTSVQRSVNTHLIIPEEYEILGTGENHKYIRLLETEVWRSYLGRKVGLLMTRPKMLAVSWEKRGSDEHPAAEVTRPARFACILRKHTMSLAFGRLLAAIVAAIPVIWLFIGSNVFRDGTYGAVISWLNDMASLENSNYPLLSGPLDSLLDAVVSVPVLGPLTFALVLALWFLMRQFLRRKKRPERVRMLQRIRSSLERRLVGAAEHGKY